MLRAAASPAACRRPPCLTERTTHLLAGSPLLPAVRGAIALKSSAYQQQLKEGKGDSLPFDKVYQCNIGNPQILGQARGGDASQQPAQLPAARVAVCLSGAEQSISHCCTSACTAQQPKQPARGGNETAAAAATAAAPRHLARLTCRHPAALPCLARLPACLPALQKPITFFRQVLSLCEYPALMEHEAASQIYPPDAIKVGGWVGGCKAARGLCLWKGQG